MPSSDGIPAETRLMYSGGHINTSPSARAKEKGYNLTFVHTSTGHSVQFPAILQSFNDSHQSRFGQELGKDRHDPAIFHHGTNRAINFTFSVFNGSIEEARHNEQNINLLISMLYPVLDKQNTFQGKPFIRVHGLNFLNNSINSKIGTKCVIPTIEYTLDLSEGIISSNKGEFYSKKIDIDINCETFIEGDTDGALPDRFPRYLKG